MILTKDEVVKMARQVWPEVSAGAPIPDGLERFATLCRAPLVAEIERLSSQQVPAWFQDQVLAVRAESDALKADAAQLRSELATANERHAGLMLAVVDRDKIIKQYAAAVKRGEA